MTLRAMYVAPLVAIGAAFAATGFADQVITSYHDSYFQPAQPAMAPAEPVTAEAVQPVSEEGQPPSEEAVYEPAQPMPAPVRNERVAARVDTSSTTTIYGERRSEDQFITDDVMKAIAAEPRISGNVGVDTYRRVVTLTGRVSTQGQVDRVGRAARNAVDRDVEIHNQVISKV